MTKTVMIAKSVTANRTSDFGELSRCVGADRLNSTDTYDNDQCQHHRVLNSGGSVFFLQKVNDLGCEALRSKFLSGLK